MNERRRIPDLFAEQELLGELPEQLDAETRRQLAEDPARAERRTALEASNRQILKDHPPRMMAAGIRARMEGGAHRQQGVHLRLALAGSSLLVLLLALLWLLLPAQVGEQDPAGSVVGPEAVRAKGDPRLEIHRRVGLRSAPVQGGDLLAAGEVLQLRYFAGAYSHGAIVSVDGRGQVTLHFPATPDADTALVSDRTVALPFSYELDDAPAYERFFFVLSRTRFDVQAIVEAIRRLGPGPDRAPALPAGLVLKETLIRKPGQP